MLRRGQVPEWASPISPINERVDDPRRWNPDVPFPDLAFGKFMSFQDKEGEVINLINRADPRSITDIIASVMDLDEDFVWLEAPNPRPQRMLNCGRRVKTILAILDTRTDPQQNTCIVFVDLRGLGLWPQWLIVPDGEFDATTFVDGLQIEFLEGWSVIVLGGQGRPQGGIARVRSGDLLEISDQ